MNRSLFKRIISSNIRPCNFLSDRLYIALLPCVATVVGVFILTTFVLTANSIPIFLYEGLEFIASNVWIASENGGYEKYGVAAAIFGTLYTSLLALLLSVPSSVALVVLINEVAPAKARPALSSILEFMSGMPTVLYGLWGVFILAPILYNYLMKPLNQYLGWVPLFSFTPRGGFSILTAGIILAIMVVPYESLLIKVAYDSIPSTYVEAMYSLGLTEAEVARLKLRMIRTSIIAASVLGYGRAVGETVAVSLVIGNTLYLGPSVLAPGYTISALIANQFGNACLYKYMPAALYASALLLLLVCLPLNIFGLYMIGKCRWSR